MTDKKENAAPHRHTHGHLKINITLAISTYTAI